MTVPPFFVHFHAKVSRLKPEEQLSRTHLDTVADAIVEQPPDIRDWVELRAFRRFVDMHCEKVAAFKGELDIMRADLETELFVLFAMTMALRANRDICSLEEMRRMLWDFDSTVIETVRNRLANHPTLLNAFTYYMQVFGHIC